MPMTHRLEAHSHVSVLWTGMNTSLLKGYIENIATSQPSSIIAISLSGRVSGEPPPLTHW